MNQQQLFLQKLLKRDVDLWNQWRYQHPDTFVDLSGIDLSQCYLFEANLSALNLRGANLSRACLIGANLSRSNLSGANLTGAYLSEANLHAADLRWAWLLGASFNAADLSGANLLGAQIAKADFAEANLRGTHLRAQSLANLPSILLERYAVNRPVPWLPQPYNMYPQQPLPMPSPQPTPGIQAPSFSRTAPLHSAPTRSMYLLPAAHRETEPEQIVRLAS